MSAAATSQAQGQPQGAAPAASQAQTPAQPASQARGPAPLGHWVPYRHLTQVVDLAGPRADGSFTVAADGLLFTLSRTGTVTPFARGTGGYSTALGPEPYLTLAGSDPVAGTRCSFNSGTLYALETKNPPGVISISPNGQARRFANVPATGLADGIAFDATGRFGHKLLVLVKGKTSTTVLALDCAGSVRTLSTTAPVMEGGIVVAPASFGAYGGDLIAQNELTGQVFAVKPDGSTVTLATSGLPSGHDTGVESAGFVPPGFGPGDSAYLADRVNVHNPFPGTDNILRLPGSELIRAGARAGDLLVATEGSAKTILVRCAGSCTVKYIAIGPAITHAEGHIVFTRPGG